MDSVLIVSNTSATFGVVSALLGAERFSRVVAAQSCSEARRSLIESSFDLIVIDSPLSDETGEDFALTAAEKTNAGIILMAGMDIIQDVSGDIEEDGVFVLPKPVSPEFFYHAVKLLTACRNRALRLESENQKLQKKIEEIRTVDRAKCVLIQTLNMTEPQAHRYIEKQAMDLRQSRAAIAENILRAYER